MRRFFKLTLSQIFLLVGLAAFALAIFGITRRQWSVNSTLPPLALSPDGETLAIGLSCRPLFGRKHPVIIHDLATSSSRTYDHHDWCIEGVAYSPDGTKLYSVGDWTLRTWDTSTGKQLERFDTGSDVSACLAVSSDGRYVASANDSEILITNTESKAVSKLGTKKVMSLGFSPDGKYLVAGTWGSNIVGWSTEDWNVAFSFKAPEHPRTLSFLPDGGLVAPHYVSATKQSPWQVSVAIYDLPSGTERAILPIPKTYAAVSSVTVSPNGKYIAAAHGGDEERDRRAITIWDTKSQQELKTWSVKRQHKQWVDEMVFSHDGETLYCASNDNTVSAQHWKRDAATSLYRSGKVFPWSFTIIGGTMWGFAWVLVRRGSGPQSVSTPLKSLQQAK